jgi:hypothetical protein
MDGICSTHSKALMLISSENSKRGHLDDLNVDGSTVLQEVLGRTQSQSYVTTDDQSNRLLFFYTTQTA